MATTKKAGYTIGIGIIRKLIEEIVIGEPEFHNININFQMPLSNISAGNLLSVMGKYLACIPEKRALVTFWNKYLLTNDDITVTGALTIHEYLAAAYLAKYTRKEKWIENCGNKQDQGTKKIYWDHFLKYDLSVRETSITSAQLSGNNVIQNIHYNIPVRPHFFVGRENTLKEIHAGITGDHRDNVLLICGIGGIGKTTVIHEYLQSTLCCEYSDNVIFVTVTHNLKDAFISTLETALDIQTYPNQTLDIKLELIQSAIHKLLGNTLIVIDNINEQDKDDLIGFHHYLNSINANILITTRTSPDKFRTLSLDELPQPEAIELFNYHYHLPHTKKQEVQELVNYAYAHTLLIELIAKVGRKKGIDLIRLIELVKDRFFRNPELQRKIDTGIHANSSGRLSQTTLYHYVRCLFEPELLDERQKNLLHFISLFPTTDIPIEHFCILFSIADNQVNEFEDELDDLYQSGWIGRKHSDSYQYRMHPLVQEIVFEKLPPNEVNCRTLLKTTATVIVDDPVLPIVFQSYARSIIDKLNFLHLRTENQ